MRQTLTIAKEYTAALGSALKKEMTSPSGVYVILGSLENSVEVAI